MPKTPDDRETRRRPAYDRAAVRRDARTIAAEELADRMEP